MISYSGTYPGPLTSAKQADVIKFLDDRLATQSASLRDIDAMMLQLLAVLVGKNGQLDGEARKEFRKKLGNSAAFRQRKENNIIDIFNNTFIGLLAQKESNGAHQASGNGEL